MSTCPQCHADFPPEELDSQNPACPVCGESLKTRVGETQETEDHDPLKAAPKIDGFEITRHIGRGGMGDVWEARQNVLGRKVAIKVLAKNLSRSEHFLARFTREAYTLGRLQHPGIVSIYDFRSSPDGLCCIIMEYVEGPKRGESTTLYDLILARELTPERVRHLIVQVLNSLQYAHEEGVIHRDIKPTNVLIDRYGRVKVVDFGIAAMPSDPNRKQLTYVGGPLGTAEYMAPEQTEDATKADHRADLYAVGVVTYELLTGFRPRGMFAMPSKAKSGIDPGWDAVVSKALQPDRDQRYGSASEMIADIQAIGTNTPPTVMPYQLPVRELRFDSEPEQFPSESTPLPVHTPTADNAPQIPSKPGDTDLLPEDEDDELPVWMLKRRSPANPVEDTQEDLTDEDSPEAQEPIFDRPEPGSMDSSMRLDRQQSAAEEPAPEIPLAQAEDLEDWLSSGPAPKGKDSANLIEVIPNLPPTREQDEKAPASKEPSAEEDTSDVRPIEDEPVEESLRPATLTGTSGTLTTEETAEDAPAVPPPSVEDLPEGDFIELCYDAAHAKPTPGDKAILFCPAIRPPTLKICVLDDASGSQGEWVRVRQPSFIIGRNEGDLIIEHDRSISGRHAEISLQKSGSSIAEFVIRDLGTTNGTFARASRAVLENGQEFLMGLRRYKLLCDCRDKPGQKPYDKLVEVTKKAHGKAFRLGRPPVIIGRDPQQCNLLILDDPFLSPMHAILKRDDRNRWVIKNYNSRNGIWIQIQEMKIVSGGEFQIGGQRLIVQLPGLQPEGR